MTSLKNAVTLTTTNKGHIVRPSTH